MNPTTEMQRLNAFVDGELGLDEQLEIEARMRESPAVRAQVERLRALREAVRERSDYHAAPDSVRTAVAAQLMSSRRTTDRPWRAWFDWRPWTAAMATAAVATLAVTLWWPALREQQRIEEDVVASHVRATLGQRTVDVASSDHHTVKPWLSARLDFSPPVNELDQPGSALLGGRVDYVDGRPVAALAYRFAGHAVDDFIWPSARADEPVATSSVRGFNIAHWTRAGMAHWLISDLNASELALLAEKLRQGEPAR